MDGRIKRAMKAEGYDLQSDEGATELQRRIDLEMARRSIKINGILVKPSDFQMHQAERVRGIMI